MAHLYTLFLGGGREPNLDTEYFRSRGNKYAKIAFCCSCCTLASSAALPVWFKNDFIIQCRDYHKKKSFANLSTARFHQPHRTLVCGLPSPSLVKKRPSELKGRSRSLDVILIGVRCLMRAWPGKALAGQQWECHFHKSLFEEPDLISIATWNYEASILLPREGCISIVSLLLLRKALSISVFSPATLSPE